MSQGVPWLTIGQTWFVITLDSKKLDLSQNKRPIMDPARAEKRQGLRRFFVLSQVLAQVFNPAVLELWQRVSSEMLDGADPDSDMKGLLHVYNSFLRQHYKGRLRPWSLKQVRLTIAAGAILAACSVVLMGSLPGLCASIHAVSSPERRWAPRVTLPGWRAF